MELLIAACLLFVALHLGVSGTPLRGWLQSRLGAGGYLGLYSLGAFISLGLMIYAYGTTPHADFIWLPSAAAYKVTKVVVFVALVLIAVGAMTRNPTAINMESAINDELTGVLKITRHPIQWGILLFAIGHLIANGDLASIVFFGTFAIVSFVGMLSMDARKRQQEGEAWQGFFETTSNIPFAAIVTGKTRFTLSDVNWLALIIGVALYGCVYWLHDIVSGGASLF